MPTFRTLAAQPSPVEAGAYIAKIKTAVEKISSSGNAMLVMKLQLHTGQEISSILTFVEAARPVVSAFCASAGLIAPSQPDVEVEVSAEIIRGRYLYVIISADTDECGDTSARVSRFISREAALRLNPKLSEIKLQEQPPVVLPIIGRSSL